MSVPKLIFRDYDIRGLYPSDLNEDVAYDIGRGIGTVFDKKSIHKIVLGRDNRLSSPTLASALAEGLVDSGIRVMDVGVTMTPIIHFLTCVEDVEGGIIVTASHNPKEYNGFRIDYKNAVPFFGEELKDLSRIVEKKEFNELSAKGTMEKKDLNPKYISFLKKKFKLKRKIKVVIDCGNGASSEIAPQILAGLGCEVFPVYCHLDSTFPHGIPDPENPIFKDKLEEEVKKNGADVGFAFDTDVDRFGVVDDKGISYDTDKVLILFCNSLLRNNRGARVVYDVKCSQLVHECVESLGGVPVMLRTGHPYFAKEVEKGALLGAEFSGHVFFGGEYFGFDDGVYAACKVLETIDKSGKALSDLMADIPKRYHTTEIKIECPDEEKFKIVSNIKDKLSSSKDVIELIDIDGTRVRVTQTGWFLIRASNTNPYLSLRVEGKTKEEAEFMLRSVRMILESYPYLNLTPLSSVKIEIS